ncbi:MAG: hypothetical protein NTX45_27245 [Proteobacteria bacterium]|nr:hypothetical protein [Pseudomonadota bacterium]
MEKLFKQQTKQLIVFDDQCSQHGDGLFMLSFFKRLPSTLPRLGVENRRLANMREHSPCNPIFDAFAGDFTTYGVLFKSDACLLQNANYSQFAKRFTLWKEV